MNTLPTCLRPREKLLSHGVRSLTDVELLALAVALRDAEAGGSKSLVEARNRFNVDRADAPDYDLALYVANWPSARAAMCENSAAI